MNSSFIWNWCARKHVRVILALLGMVRVEFVHSDVLSAKKAEMAADVF